MKKKKITAHLDDNHRILTSSYKVSPYHGIFHECAAMTVRWPDSQPHLTYNLMVALCPFLKRTFGHCYSCYNVHNHYRGMLCP